MSELIIGTECGVSDPTSGLAANPLIGQLSDLIVKEGGTSILSETTEFIGAEHLLARRAINKEVHDRIFEIVHRYEDSLRLVGEEVREGNPSPGNKAGGLTCLEEKSLGCVQKGGNTPIVDVLHYGETVRRRGLTVLQTPGNDLVSATGLAAAGAHLILFTTGRGTPFGALVPTLKLATNTALASRKAGWIDYDAGGLAQGDAWEPHIQALLQLVLDTASGAPTRAEAAGYREIAIWKDGVTL